MSDDLKELNHYFIELSKMYNEAMFLLKEAALEVRDQSLQSRIDSYLTTVELKKKGA